MQGTIIINDNTSETLIILIKHYIL